MLNTILIYGATGFSGRLIADEAERRRDRDELFASRFRIVLAGRNGPEVAALARRKRMEARVFGLEDRDDVLGQLRDVDVLLNAAGPFALTAPHLARAALGARCHYVDINGEAEVYMQIDDLARSAAARHITMVSGAGHTAAASDLLLEVALRQLRRAIAAGQVVEIGAIRIAMSRVLALSRGSLETLWRSLREQVRVVRLGNVETADGRLAPGHVYWHEPVGRLERTFDYSAPVDESLSTAARRALKERSRAVASAANLLDTITARRTVERHSVLAERIEAYVEVGEAGRILFQAAPLLTPLAAMPWARAAVRLPLGALPDGPTPQERRDEPHVIVLEIEDRLQTRVVHWVWRTPNPYDFTARVALETATTIVSRHNDAANAKKLAADAKNLYGWHTPAELLLPAVDVVKPIEPTALSAAPDDDTSYLRGCTLLARATLVPEYAS